jgi:16S rRNA (guanine966-N2)-methyltransferase
MRIVAGDARGRKLATPADDRIRPTSDRVRQSLFDVLGSVRDLKVLDLFAGTGALGLEALSRGAAFVWFVDSSHEAAALVQRNVDTLRYRERCAIWKADASRVLSRFANDEQKVDLVFLDPPYHRFDLPRLMEAPAWRMMLSPQAKVVIECDADAPPKLDPQLWNEIDRRRYGGTELIFVTLC